MDSATAAALTAREGFALYALTFAYGQRHAAEIDAARRVAAALAVARHEVLTIDLRAFGGSARNTIFLSFALAWAEVLEASDIVIGLATLATRAGVEGRQRVHIRTPLIRMTKAEIVRTGTTAGVDYALTLSCYEPGPAGEACGRCDACTLRRKGFVQAGVPDPTRYRA